MRKVTVNVDADEYWPTYYFVEEPRRGYYGTYELPAELVERYTKAFEEYDAASKAIADAMDAEDEKRKKR